MDKTSINGVSKNKNTSRKMNAINVVDGSF